MKPKPIEEQLKTLDNDEIKLLSSVENDEWIPNYETKEQFENRKTNLKKTAQDILHRIPYKDKSLDEIELIIHIPQNIFHKIETLAEKAGIDYQNWIVDTLKKVANE